MSRGLQVIVTAPATPAASEQTVRDALVEAYSKEPFVVVREKPPETKHVRGAHRAEVFANYDPRTGLVTAIGVIDNLVKGAAGSAIQNANLMLGIEEEAGLPGEGVYP
jgi:N-acetyl-gamma-glutamyl-phosphate reductase